MKLKEPPIFDKLPLSTFLLHRDWYKIDYTYQREAGTWELPDEQYLIDTILRGLGMPPIFIHKKREERFIVDGQQRLNTIWKFRDDKIELGERFSADVIKENNSKRKYSELKKDFQQRFDDYPIPIIYLEGYNDEEIRDMFRRLQAGKPLTVGERLNSYAGEIVPTIRKLGEHHFFKSIVPFRLKRYKNYQIAAILLYLEKEGIKDISPTYLYEFFDKNREIDTDSAVYSRVVKVLNYLTDAFKAKTGELDKVSWIVTLYLMTSELIRNYAMHDQMDNLKNFFIDFYQQIANASSSGNKELIDFDSANSAGTTGQTNITLRHKIIMKTFLSKYNPLRLDEDRLFSYEQKLAIFRRDKETCQVCGRKLEFGSPETHYHHKEPWIKGGETEIDKGLLVCKECHLKVIHGKSSSVI